jgi:hypothetical protein
VGREHIQQGLQTLDASGHLERFPALYADRRSQGSVVLDPVSRGDDHHGHLARSFLGAHVDDGLSPIQAGHHQVHEDHVRHHLLHHLQSLKAIVGLEDGVGMGDCREHAL